MKFSLLSTVLNSRRICFWIVLFAASFLSFWKLGNHALFEWDESRYAVNAYEMTQHHDYVNYYFYDQIDLAVSKPPLYLWAITVGYRMFGYNEFALRFFSALATVLFFLVLFQWVSLYKNFKTAFFTCLLLMSCKAIIGYHVGRTGDMDAFLLLFTYLGLYHFSKYIDFEKKYAILWSGIFFGLAFYSKGTAAFLLFPSLFIFILLRKKLFSLLKDFRFWLAVLLFIGIAGSWYLLVLNYGVPYHDSVSGASNNWQQLFLYDTFTRFTHPGIAGDPQTAHDYFFYFKTLDSRFNLWNYLLYLLSFSFIILNFRRWKYYLQNPFYSLLLISIITTSIILTASKTKLGWYLTPVVPLISVMLVTLIESTSRKLRVLGFISVVLFAFTLTRQIALFNEKPNGRGSLIRDNKNIFQNASVTYWYNSQNEQDLFAYFKWYPKKLRWLGGNELQTFHDDSTAVLFGKGDEQLTYYLSLHHDLKFQQRENYFLLYH